MRRDNGLPSYEQLFGALDFRTVDEGRSVYSPAAYLADLLQLIDDSFEGAPLTGPDRRPDLTAIPLDGEHTYKEFPYLDIVNRVLAAVIGPDAHRELKGLPFPFALPFDLDQEKVRRYLRHFRVGPVELYELFADRVDADIVAREFLGLSAGDVTLVTTVRTAEKDVLASYGPGASLAGLQDAATFVRAARLTATELDAVVHFGTASFIHQGGPPVTTDGTKLVWGDGAKPVPAEWFERVSRFVRLARRTGLTLGETDVILRRCCGNKVDLKVLAVVVHLQRGLDLPADVVTSLAAPLDGAQFDAVFNEPRTATGDVLAPRNKEYRVWAAAAVGLPEGDLITVVKKVRQRYLGTGAQSGPFDRDEIGLDALSLLHRVGRLTGALDVTVTELFGVLDALGNDPSSISFGGLLDVAPGTTDLYRMLEAPDVGSGLCLAQLLLSVVRWMQALGMDSAELGAILARDSVDEDWESVHNGLNDELDQVALTAGLFVSDRFGDRAARVAHEVLTQANGVVSDRDDRLLRLDPAMIRTAAYDAITDMVALTEEDFRGLGLANQLSTKIFTNLVHLGVIDSSGLLVDTALPAKRLSSDFNAIREPLFELIGGICETRSETPGFYPSDLAKFNGLTSAEQAELYDNLVVHGYLAPSGEVLSPDFFAEPQNADAFAVTVALDSAAPEVFQLLQDRADQLNNEPVAVNLQIFPELSGQQRAELLESLRFNGYVDSDGNYADPAALLRLTLDEFSLHITFHPYRATILRAIQGQLTDVRTAVLTVDAEAFAEIADTTAARLMADALSSQYLVAHLVPTDMRPFFADPANVVTLTGQDLFSDTDLVTATSRISAALTEQQPYLLDPQAIADLGFDEEETGQVIDFLIARGDLDEELTVPEERLGWFLTPTNALGFTLDGLEDYATDVFFLLHTIARELTAGMAQITDTLTAQADQQRAALVTVLADATGLAAVTVEALCEGVAGSLGDALDVLVAGGRRTYDRIRRFGLLVARLGLDAVQVGVAFHDQDLAGKFPEPLVLPSTVDRIDALLDGVDGTRYLFRDAAFWVYAKNTEVPAGPRPLTDLSPQFAGLTAVDAAFTDAQDTEWIVSGPHAFIRLLGTGHWVRTNQVWGTVRNTLAEPSRIDSAFVDDEGRTFLFCGSQYVRYSGPDYTFVDEGYPRAISEWWDGEGRHTPLPARFQASVDASFQDRDGTTHLFTGDRCLAVGSESGDQPTAEVWGQVRNLLAGTGRIDAAYTQEASTVLFSGNQIVRYSDCVENDGVLVDEGYPRAIESYLPNVPVGFDGSVEAAFIDDHGVTHLFKDGRTVGLEPGETGAVVPTSQRWGVLGPVLADGVVDSALVGQDGRTYLFSADRYVRYSGADYSVVDLGYPRAIAGDWGGLTRVGASFVLDGATHLFGTGGSLFQLTLEHEPDLIAGTVSRSLREKLQEHGITIGVDTRITGTTSDWRLDGEQGIKLVLRRVTDPVTKTGKIEVRDDSDVQYHVRYSTRSYTTPDAGYPRPLAGNWWNLPEGGFTSVDAVFTGQDDRTYLFSGNQYVVFDNKHRWWSEPQPLNHHWDSLPFDRVDAAFVGKDSKTYVFSGARYVRYSNGDYTKLDDRYPAPTTTFWGNVSNSIARHGRVDAVLVVDSATYLFSGNQYVRYDGPDRTTVAAGYPRSLDALATEPRFANLPAPLTGRIDAAFADRRNAYLVVDGRCHVVSDSLYRRYEQVGDVHCAFIEDGSVLVQETYEWQRYSSIEATTVAKTPVRPRVLRKVPAGFRDGLDAVLRGADGNTYLFKGTRCFDVSLSREFALAEDWGYGRNTIAQDNRIDAAFTAPDGRTYVFSGDQFVVYKGPQVVGAHIDGEPRLIREHWAGLTSVTLAYVQSGTTYVFETPAPDGTMRYRTYTGTAYTDPEEGTAGPDFWDIPADLRPAGFTAPDAVLVEGENTLLLIGDQYLAHHSPSGRWSQPRPVSRLWPGIEHDWQGPLTAAFTGPDSAVHFFFAGRFTSASGGTVAPYRPIRDEWGRSRNNFTSGGRVDAAFVDSGDTTFLFSGDQYVRYTGTAYRYADPGYPKLITDNLRKEDAFKNLPDTFEDVITTRAESGPVFDAVIANQRTVYLFIGGDCHVVSRTASATYDLNLGRVRNTITDTGRVDAALVSNGHTFLFSGDQYVRYSGSDYAFIDDGYPRTIETGLAAELDVQALPVELRDGLDAAFRGTDGDIYLFAGPAWFRAGGPEAAQPIKGTWGKVRNAFTDAPGLDAAFTAATGELYVFRGGQYARYSDIDRTFVDDGYPRTVRDDWGDLPGSFEGGIDTAFVLDGRTYLGLGQQYVRYSGGDYLRIDRTYPQTFRQRWASGPDYRLDDLHTIARFAELARAHDGVAEFAAAGPGAIADPYARLSEMFGWDIEELRWLMRRRGMLTEADDRVELELLLKLVEVFTAAEAFGTGPSGVFEVWQGLHGSQPSAAATAEVLYGLLARRFSPSDWAVLSREVHDELNVAERDALVSAVLGKTGADTTRDLFEQLLIDVDMGSRGMTSPVREAIAATQLFLHRYFLDLEEVEVADGRGKQVRDKLRTWWAWMRNYRTWEANRKVFLYPENYLRPELRDRKTPAFRELESDLLQGDITPAAVERAYKKYLDEYTEVSRLAIAGGYVYTAGAEDTRDLILFGRTRTQPRRYYYRRAQFRSADKLTAAWEPWVKVDVQIEADEVHPVHAFNRVFVFWTTVESVAPAATSSTTLTTKQQGSTQEVTAPPPTERVKIHYSFYNLNKEWVPAQTLAMDTRREGSIYDVKLAVELSGDPESIVVSCTYSVVTTTTTTTGDKTTVTTTKKTYTQMAALTPELVEVALPAPVPQIGAGTVPDPIQDVFTAAEIAAAAGTDVTNRPKVVRFTSPSRADYGPWFSIDHKGGSFLCRPSVVAPADEVTLLSLPTNTVGLPKWERIDAAVELPDGTRFFFDNSAGRYVTVSKGKTSPAASIVDRWGRVASNLARTGIVDAVLSRGERTYLFSGPQYFRYSGPAFGTVDAGYPKDIETNTEDLPRWPKIDAAFTDLNGVEWFYSVSLDRIERSGSLGTQVPGLFRGRTGRFEAALVDVEQQVTYVFMGEEYLRYTGKDYRAPDDGYPRRIADNDDNIPQWTRIGAALRQRGVSYYFDDATQNYTEIAEKPAGGRRRRPPTETTKPARDLARGVTTGGLTKVDAAYVQNGFLYLAGGKQYVRYTLTDTVPDVVDLTYPKTMTRAINAVFLRRGPRRYVFSGSDYAQLLPGQELSDVTGFVAIDGNWGDLPADFAADFTGVLDSESDKQLYFFLGSRYVRYSTTITVPRPFERAALPLEIVRLTTSTAAQLNQKLLGGGVASLLDPASQELDERPAFRTDRTDRNTIQVRDDRVVASRLPASTHLDFQSANGIYYWEIFFHAPVLIAQALNEAQRFADARQWYEYVFDPTEPAGYWRFLPFLAVDLAALADRCRRDMAELAARLTEAGFDDPAGLAGELTKVIADLATLTPAFRENRPLTDAELAILDRLASSRLHLILADAVTAAQARLTPRIREPQRTLWRGIVAALQELQEHTALVAGLRRQYDFIGDRESLIEAYRSDPFDPHAIADLRPVAHRRAVVMAYIDNVLDWGDMLFRQYTGESIDEARMLYIFAWDLLGMRPELPGRQALDATRTYQQLGGADEDDRLAELTGGGIMLQAQGEVHAGIANGYFRIPDNSFFTDYWDRVEDRLRKIRQSLNILGISQPLPLFEPPIDPMALVRSVAAGIDVGSAVAASATVAIPHYRFEATFRRAQDLADKVRQFGNDLLSVLERRDGEELNLLQNRQDGVIQDMTRAVKAAQIETAAANLRELQVSRDAADQRITHYKQLIANGLSPLEMAQIDMMARASVLHLTSGLLKVGAGIAYAAPQSKIGPFIVGVEWGGKQLGAVLDKAAEIPQALGEGFSVTGELLGVCAEHDRTSQEWAFQQATAENDLAQIKHQIAAAEQQLVSAQRDAAILDQEIAHNKAVATHLKEKFGTAELYRWMAGRLSGLYYQSYTLAYDTARAAERALRFECGLNDTETTYIRPLYWESRRGGLLAGESLGVDLDRLGQAYADAGARGLEITKRVSLIEMDPVAVLRLATNGICEFALTEELFDHDFPGHFRRQIRTVSVAFFGDDGEMTQPNATLTQAGHKTVLAADPKAVRHLLDPKEQPPDTVRSDWRANQQIALSHVGEQENNGLFELRYDDPRYLPFEGTGAVSTWRLELSGRRPVGLRDVVVTIRYTAEDGGEVFANAVKGMLKPYPAARFIDVATEFPDEWQEFTEGDGTELTLPITPDMFPGLTGHQITAVYPHYVLANGSAARLTLGGTRLTEGKSLSATDLRVNDDGSGWSFGLEGDKESLASVGLVLTYRAALG